MAPLLHDKACIITGAGSGIGRATALVFAREGARLALADRTEAGLRETVEMARGVGVAVLPLVADVGQEDQVEQMVARTVAEYGRLDCAFNNAGVHGSQLGAAGARLAEIPAAVFDQLILVNLRGVWLCMKHQIGQMLRQKAGAIVNAASVGAHVGLRGSSAYVASKFGVLGLTKSAALEYARDGLRINAVSPGFADTPLATETMQRRGAEVLAMIPAGRLATPKEVGETVAFLCSDRASYTSGAAYAVDGAYIAG